MASVVYYEKEATQCCGNGSLFSHFKKNGNNQSRLDPYYGEKWAENLNKMSSKEREYILEDIHGVADAFEETQAFLDDQLELLNKSIDNVGEKVTFDIAMRMDPSYVTNRDFRLLFLRAENFDIEKAAQKLINHFDTKLQLFGEEKLVKDITFDDLSVEDKASLCSGSHQYLGTRDRPGRHVAFFFADLMCGATFENFARARWYQYMTEFCESTQRHGIVIVAFGIYHSNTIRYSMNVTTIVNAALPVKCACIHYCLIKQNIPVYARSLFHVLGAKRQVRLRIHIEETPVLLLYKLQSFGIDPTTIPMGYDGKPQTKLFFELLEKRKLFERQRQCQTIRIKNPKPTSSAGIQLTSNDVILGQGKGQNHRGNMALDKLIDLEIEAHNKAPSSFHKSCIVLATVKRVQASGGRFLRFNKKNGAWIIANDDAARSTVSTRFRNKAKKVKSTPVQTVVLNDKPNQYAPDGKQSYLNHEQRIQFQLELLQQSQLQLLTIAK